jgi:hypothetical protein
VPEMTLIKGDETDPIKPKGHWGLKKVPRYESTTYTQNVLDDMCLSEGKYGVNKYKSDQLYLKLGLKNQLMLKVWTRNR